MEILRLYFKDGSIREIPETGYESIKAMIDPVVSLTDRSFTNSYEFDPVLESWTRTDEPVKLTVSEMYEALDLDIFYSCLKRTFDMKETDAFWHLEQLHRFISNKKEPDSDTNLLGISIELTEGFLGEGDYYNVIGQTVDDRVSLSFTPWATMKNVPVNVPTGMSYSEALAYFIYEVTFYGTEEETAEKWNEIKDTISEIDEILRKTDDEAVEAVAEVWAAIDGKTELFEAEKGVYDHTDLAYTGTHEGYIADAEEMLDRLKKKGYVLKKIG